MRLSLRPALIGQWTQTGIKQTLACGEVWYLLERPIGTRLYRLHLKTNLKHPVQLDVNLTCPGLSELGPWQTSAGPGALIRPPQRTVALERRVAREPSRMDLDLGLTGWFAVTEHMKKCPSSGAGSIHHGPSGGGSRRNSW